MSIAIRHDDSVMVREIDGEVLVLDTRANRIHQFNRTASIIWRRCGEEPHTIASALVAEFSVDEETALRDVVETLSTLRSLRLIVNA